MNSLKSFSLIILLSLFSSSSLADCLYNGRWYPEGAIIGNHICINGKWIHRGGYSNYHTNIRQSHFIFYIE